MKSLIETITLEGPMNSSFDFEIYPLDTKFEPISCIYIITRLLKNSNDEFEYKIIYIDQADDISNQIKHHYKGECFKQHGANCIGIHQESGRKKEFIKSVLIQTYKPPCNEEVNH